MTKFPDPIPLPEQVLQSRKKRKITLTKAAKSGIFIRSAIILAEFIGFYLFSSASLLMDAIASSLDIITSLLLVLFIKLAARPPDENHPFGHGRYEPLAGLQLGLMLVIIGAGMIFQQMSSMAEAEVHEVINPLACLIPLGATCLLEVCYQFMIRVAKKEHSPALAADAKHYRIDALTSLFASVALVIAAFWPSYSVLIDHFGAIAIAILMIFIGISAARENVGQIMDKKPCSSFFDRVKQAALNVKGVLEIEKVRIQLYGPDAHVDIDIEVDPKLPVDDAHEISQHVRAEIQKEWHAVQDVTVHIEPFYPGDH